MVAKAEAEAGSAAGRGPRGDRATTAPETESRLAEQTAAAEASAERAPRADRPAGRRRRLERGPGRGRGAARAGPRPVPGHGRGGSGAAGPGAGRPVQAPEGAPCPDRAAPRRSRASDRDRRGRPPFRGYHCRRIVRRRGQCPPGRRGGRSEAAGQARTTARPRSWPHRCWPRRRSRWPIAGDDRRDRHPGRPRCSPTGRRTPIDGSRRRRGTLGRQRRRHRSTPCSPRLRAATGTAPPTGSGTGRGGDPPTSRPWSPSAAAPTAAGTERRGPPTGAGDRAPRGR